MIPFNKPYFSGNELKYIKQAVSNNKISGNGIFTEKSQLLLQEKYGFNKCLLTNSGTDALEMCALLCDIKLGDEVIIPSFTFVSTANAFALRGANIKFADSSETNPNISVNSIKELISKKTKAIVIVHYGGIACDIKEIKKLCENNNILLIEDAAHSIDGYYNEIPLGSIGDFSAFSFHETKNIICGEGGMIVINNKKYIKQAEIIWEKGTNRVDFNRGKSNFYEWKDLGSSFLTSEISAAFLYAQLEKIDKIQKKRKKIWDSYFQKLKNLVKENHLKFIEIPKYATQNYHLFCVLCNDSKTQKALLKYLNKNGVMAISHYKLLHNSEYFKDKYKGTELINAQKYSDNLIRLPFFFELKETEILKICDLINNFYK